MLELSQWTASQQEEILQIAWAVIPGIVTIVIPPGFNAAKGGEAAVDFLEEYVWALAFLYVHRKEF